MAMSFPADQTIQLDLESGTMVSLRASEQPLTETRPFVTAFAIGGKEDERKKERERAVARGMPQMLLRLQHGLDG